MENINPFSGLVDDEAMQASQTTSGQLLSGPERAAQGNTPFYKDPRNIASGLVMLASLAQGRNEGQSGLGRIAQAGVTGMAARGGIDASIENSRNTERGRLLQEQGSVEAANQNERMFQLQSQQTEYSKEAMLLARKQALENAAFRREQMTAQAQQGQGRNFLSGLTPDAVMPEYVKTLGPNERFDPVAFGLWYSDLYGTVQGLFDGSLTVRLNDKNERTVVRLSEITEPLESSGDVDNLLKPTQRERIEAAGYNYDPTPLENLGARIREGRDDRVIDRQVYGDDGTDRPRLGAREAILETDADIRMLEEAVRTKTVGKRHLATYRRIVQQRPKDLKKLSPETVAELARIQEGK